jgi:antitoxin HicB
MAKQNPHRGSTLDSFLEQEGTLGEFQAQAIKEVIAWQLAEAMKDRKLSKTRLAELMHTSRTQINRMLDPNDGNVTIETLQRAAALVGRRVQVVLV